MKSSEELEVLENLLACVQGENSPANTAHLLLDHYGSLSAIAECLTVQGDHPSISQNARMLLSMIPDLCRKRELDRLGEHPLLNTLAAARRYAEALYIGVHYERIYLLCLDHEFRLIRHCLLGEGSVNEVSFYPRKILQEALLCGAQAVILCHNHLSGWCFFSEADLAATREFLRLCSYIQLPFLDHLLVSDGQVSSMRSKAHIPEADWRAVSPLTPSLGKWRLAPSDGRLELLPQME